MNQPNRDRLFRGYGPLIGFTAMFLAIAVLVPSQTRELNTGAGDNSLSSLSDSGEVDGEVIDETAEDGTSSPDSEVAGETTVPGASGSAGSAGRTGEGRTVTGSNGGTAGAPGSAGSGPATVGGCADRTLQVPHDPYSPPCRTFTGDNGGATSPGVTRDTITVAVRLGGFANGMLDALSKVANAKIPNEPPQLIANTINGLVDYFNNNFEMYGRKIKLVNYDGKGDILKEMTGGGQEAAEADALKVQQEIKAFADVSAVSPVYADALSRRQIVNIGAPYVSREWLKQRRPFSWSQFTDCSTTVESVASYYVTKLGKRNADFAGAGLKGQPRRAAVIAPENSWYQECVNAGLKIIEGAGLKAELNEKYRLDINQMSIQAGEKLAKLKNAKITTVICGCDPLFLTFLTAKAKEQNYNPEWVITGVALIDNDLIGSIMEQGQWSRSFGVSFSGAPQPEGKGLGYAAYKSVRKDEPSIAVELIYNQLELLAIGIQMAGPRLNPLEFERGMFAYPTRTGPSGTWGFKPGDYSTSDDAREVFWNRTAVSPQTRERGTYQNPNGDARFPIGHWPGSAPRVSP